MVALASFGNEAELGDRELVLVVLSILVINAKLKFEAEWDAIDYLAGTGSFVHFHQRGGDPILRKGGAIQGHNGGATAGAQVRHS